MRRSKTETDDSLDIAVEEREAWKRRLTVTVDAARVSRMRGKERDKLSKKLRLKGFRAGKVPAHVVEQRYGDLVDQRTVQRLVEDAYREAVRRRSLNPIGAPEFGQVHYAQGENLTFQVDIEIMPSLKLERLGGFRISRPDLTVSDEDVENVLQRLRKERGVWEPLEGKPEKGDLVAVRITNLGDGPAGSGDGAAPAGMSPPGSLQQGAAAPGGDPSGELYRFPLGSGYAIPEVEDAIGTVSPGERGTFDVHFPDDFSDAAVAGQDRELQIELVEVKRRRLDPLDDDFATQLGDYDTLDELKQQIHEDLVRHHEDEAEQRVRDEIIDSIIEANAFSAPDSLVEGYLDRILGSGDEPGASETSEAQSEARRSVRPIAEQQLKRELVLEHLAEELKIEPSDEDVDSHIAAAAERRGLDMGELRKRWLREGGLESVRRRVVIDAVFDHLKGLSTIE